MPLTSFSIDNLIRNLTQLDSFRLTFGSHGRPASQMTLVVRPVKALAFRVGDGTGQPSLIRVGDRGWVGGGDAGYQEIPAPLIASLGDYPLESVPVDFISINDTNLDLYLNLGQLVTDELGLEDKNGFSAHHYRITPTPLTRTFLPLSDGTAIDLWVADKLHLVGYLLSFKGAPLVSADISHPNDPANAIVAPR